MSLLLPGSSAPSNLHLAPHQISMHVEGDVYRICQRLAKEVPNGDRLFIVMHEDHPKPYVVMEHCDDGVERFVYRTEELDERLLAKLREIQAIPLDKRLADFERTEAALAHAQKEQELEELWYTMGERMHHQMEKDGFIDSRGKNLPLSGVVGPRSQRAQDKRRVVLPPGVKERG